MKLYKTIRFDLRNGLGKQGYRYLGMAVMAVIFSVTCLLKTYGYMKRIGGSMAGMSVVNILLCLFQGKEPFNPDELVVFDFPVEWFLLFLYCAYIHLSYPYKNITEYGTQMFIRIQSRGRWWFSKCVWVICGTALSWALFFAGVFGVAAMAGLGLDTGFSTEICEAMWQIYDFSPEKTELILLLGLMPVVTAVTINLLQLCLGLFMERVYSFLTVAVLLFASAYFQMPVLIGNFAMVKRSVYCGGRMTISMGLCIDGAVIALCLLAGYLRICRYDLLKKETT